MSRRYLIQSWKAFVTEGNRDDLLEASIAFSIPAAFALMKSFNALKEYKKKLAGEAAKGSRVSRSHGWLDGNGRECQAVRTDLKASTKVRLDAEREYVNLLDEKKMLEKRLAGAETEFTANFYNTKAYANFSAFFASVGQ
ncbi:hypothetical protein Adt_14510 [Abeliophyllum distichum]|uniref:Uncharacterized protein n=1 Tax=Abeliophyllum distichum TaxID=126358 RepID=A0ABD1TZU7_9LAMI